MALKTHRTTLIRAHLVKESLFMTLPNDNLRMSAIANMYGSVRDDVWGTHRLSEYYGAAAGVSTGGTIRMSQFRGKTANVDVFYHTASGGRVRVHVIDTQDNRNILTHWKAVFQRRTVYVRLNYSGSPTGTVQGVQEGNSPPNFLTDISWFNPGDYPGTATFYL